MSSEKEAQRNLILQMTAWLIISRVLHRNTQTLQLDNTSKSQTEGKMHLRSNLIYEVNLLIHFTESWMYYNNIMQHNRFQRVHNNKCFLSSKSEWFLKDHVTLKCDTHFKNVFKYNKTTTRKPWCPHLRNSIHKGISEAWPRSRRRTSCVCADMCTRTHTHKHDCVKQRCDTPIYPPATIRST